MSEITEAEIKEIQTDPRLAMASGNKMKEVVSRNTKRSKRKLKKKLPSTVRKGSPGAKYPVTLVADPSGLPKIGVSEVKKVNPTAGDPGSRDIFKFQGKLRTVPH